MTKRHFPTVHKSRNWNIRIPQVMMDILNFEWGYECHFEKDFLRKIAATQLGQELSNFNNQSITRDAIRKIAEILRPKAQKQHEEYVKYELKSKHLWAKKSYDYLTRRIEDNVIEQNPKSTKCKDTLVVGEFKCLMLVPRIYPENILEGK